MNINPILNVDSYKTSHYLQYPPGAEIVSSYIESRGGEYASSVFFGLQMFLKQYLSKPVTSADIDEAANVLTAHGVPFNQQGWDYIVQKHGGYLPLEIEAIPEGTLLPVSNVLLQARNTDPECAWLTSYIETALLRAVWYPTTIATRSHDCRAIIERALLDTADSTDGLEFKLHDFGARGDELAGDGCDWWCRSPAEFYGHRHHQRHRCAAGVLRRGDARLFDSGRRTFDNYLLGQGA